jgi:FkbM family methyltransferase
MVNMGSRNDVQTKRILVEETGQTISASRYDLKIMAGVGYEIFVDSGEQDEITESIANQTYSFPAPYHLLLDLVRPGGKVLDLGAHIGTFSLFAAALGYQVVSVDASPCNSALLRESAEKNEFDEIQTIFAAVSNRAGTLEFIQAGPYGLVDNPFLHSPTISVPAITIDELLIDIGWDRVDFIKMDIEGSEVAAIQGMTQLLSRADAPSILYESNGHTLHFFGETPSHLMALLEGFGYRCYLVESGSLIPTQSSDLQLECNVDCLAVKHLPGRLDRWRIASPMGFDERIAKVLSSCADPNSHVRAYIGRTLENADSLMLSDSRVVNALVCLEDDADADVRAATAWRQESRPVPVQMSELRQTVSELRQTLLEREAEIARLRELVRGYENGRFIRTMRALNHLWMKVKRSLR